MTSDDLARIVENLSSTLAPVQRMITGAAYFTGIMLFIAGVAKLKKIADAGANSNSHDPIFVPLVYFAVGAGLCYLPSFLAVMANTTFGVNNILQYTSTNPFDFYTAMVRLIQTAGAFWFVRGCVLLATASAPGKQQGGKGVAYLFAGILAINYYSTVGALDFSVSTFISAMASLKQSAGY